MEKLQQQQQQQQEEKRRSGEASKKCLDNDKTVKTALLYWTVSQIVGLMTLVSFSLNSIKCHIGRFWNL